jgi:hypothetical protein
LKLLGQKMHPRRTLDSLNLPQEDIMAGKLLILAPALFLLTACQHEELSLPVTHAATVNATTPTPVNNEAPKLKTDESCYSFTLLRPKDQRATAVQARLRQADKMAAGFDPHVVSVDLVGDHANILALQFPVKWPEAAPYSQRISSVIDEYFSSSDIQDALCNSGFAEVRLSARGLRDGKIHPIWTAQVTVAGLTKDPQ